MSDLKPFVLADNINYVAAFLTFSCQLRCTYCINHHGGNLVKARRMSGEDWIRGLNRIVTRPDLPITLQGGEPTVHKDFYKIVNGILPTIPLDLLTNLETDETQFMHNVPPSRFKRHSPYASIRVSYHHGQSTFDKLTDKVKRMGERGYSIGIWEVDHPDYHGQVIYRQQQAHSLGIDYRLKEFLGPHNGDNYGTFKYPGAVNDYFLRKCNCRTSEFLIAPDGHIHRCHSDLYAGRMPVGHILDADPDAWGIGTWKPCAVYGKCNSCDIKVKTNRFQEYGHSSVEIKDISNPYSRNTEHVSTVVNTYGKQDSKVINK